MIAAVVLAAGAARRFGAQKLLVPVGGMPLVRLAVLQLLRPELDEVVVVLGRDAEQVEAALAGCAVRFIRNPHYADGMSTSLRAGIAALGPDVDAALVALGDQPLTHPTIVPSLLRAYHAEHAPINAPSYRGVRGNPVLFAASVFPELLRVEGDRGAREVIARDPGRVRLVPFTIPAPPDVDAPADIDLLRAHLARGVQLPSGGEIANPGEERQ